MPGEVGPPVLQVVGVGLARVRSLLDRRQKGQEPLDRLDRSQVVTQQRPGLVPGLRHDHALHAHRTSRFRDGQRKVIPSTTTTSGTSTPVDYVTDTPILAPGNAQRSI